MTALPPDVAEEIAALAAFLLCSGVGLPYQPPTYGPFRFLDAARRALAILEASGVENPALADVRKRIEEVVFAPIESMDCCALMEELSLEMAKGLKEMAP